MAQALKRDSLSEEPTKTLVIPTMQVRMSKLSASSGQGCDADYRAHQTTLSHLTKQSSVSTVASSYASSETRLLRTQNPVSASGLVDAGAPAILTAITVCIISTLGAEYSTAMPRLRLSVLWSQVQLSSWLQDYHIPTNQRSQACLEDA